MTDATCVVADCEADRCNSRGWCWKHYTRWRRGQRIEDQTVAELLEANADHSNGPDSCWEWTGRRATTGYGAARGTYAHRLMLSTVLGRDLADGECALHRCDNPPCVNPRHLFVGSVVDNVNDMVAKGRHGGCYYDLPVEDIAWLYVRHVSPDRIADLFDVSPIVVRSRVKEMGLPSRRPGRPTKTEVRRADEAISEYLQRQVQP